MIKEEWISVEDELPEYSRGSSSMVLIWPRNLLSFDYPVCRYGYWKSNFAVPDFFHPRGWVKGVTHWMPLPEGPGDAK